MEMMATGMKLVSQLMVVLPFQALTNDFTITSNPRLLE
jgi:hypothetical protein